MKYGEYVRTKQGYIGQLININEKWVNPFELDTRIEIRRDELPKTHLYLDYCDIVNHSKNIIDLIQLGDCAVFFDKNLPAEYIYNIEAKDGKYNINKYKNVKGKDIKEILTKEMYKQNVFKVVE